MTTLLVSHRAYAEHGGDIARRAHDIGLALEILTLPADSEARLPESECARADLAYFSLDVLPAHSRQFFSAVRKAPKLGWLHVFNAGVDHPIFTEMLARGVRLTTSSGMAAVPIAQTAITGLLMLARNFPYWLDAQRQRRWEPMRTALPRDLEGQTAVVLGIGHIGREIARLARALGLKVVGVRRHPRGPDDPVDEMHPPERLAEIAARADWLVIACPLTRQTRGLVSADVIARLARGARIVNIARGEIVDEAALIDALRGGRLAGAYLDVFQEEPLPPASPLWDLPNVIVTPHNAGAAEGNDRRIYQIFVENLARWHRGETLINEVQPNSEENTT